MTSFVCGFCLKQSQQKMQVCGKCRLRHYCSRSCQVAHWEQHRSECHSYRADDVCAFSNTKEKQFGLQRSIEFNVPGVLACNSPPAAPRREKLEWKRMHYKPSLSIDDMEPRIGPDQQIRDQVGLVNLLDGDDESAVTTSLKDIPTPLMDH